MTDMDNETDAKQILRRLQPRRRSTAKLIWANKKNLISEAEIEEHLLDLTTHGYAKRYTDGYTISGKGRDYLRDDNTGTVYMEDLATSTPNPFRKAVDTLKPAGSGQTRPRAQSITLLMVALDNIGWGSINEIQDEMGVGKVKGQDIEALLKWLEKDAYVYHDEKSDQWILAHIDITNKSLHLRLRSLQRQHHVLPGYLWRAPAADVKPDRAWESLAEYFGGCHSYYFSL